MSIKKEKEKKKSDIISGKKKCTVKTKYIIFPKYFFGKLNSICFRGIDGRES
jgi:hypothetical protein